METDGGRTKSEGQWERRWEMRVWRVWGRCEFSRLFYLVRD